MSDHDEAKRLRGVLSSVEHSLMIARSYPRTDWPKHIANELKVIGAALAAPAASGPESAETEGSEFDSGEQSSAPDAEQSTVRSASIGGPLAPSVSAEEPRCAECNYPLDASGNCTRRVSGAPDDQACVDPLDLAEQTIAQLRARLARTEQALKEITYLLKSQPSATEVFDVLDDIRESLATAGGPDGR